MKKLLMYSCLVLVLAGCSNRNNVTLKCSVDDTQVFVAFNVKQWNVDSGDLYIYALEGRIIRHLQLGEACKEVIQ